MIIITALLYTLLMNFKHINQIRDRELVHGMGGNAINAMIRTLSRYLSDSSGDLGAKCCWSGGVTETSPSKFEIRSSVFLMKKLTPHFYTARSVTCIILASYIYSQPFWSFFHNENSFQSPRFPSIWLAKKWWEISDSFSISKEDDDSIIARRG